MVRVSAKMIYKPRKNDKIKEKTQTISKTVENREIEFMKMYLTSIFFPILEQQILKNFSQKLNKIDHFDL